MSESTLECRKATVEDAERLIEFINTEDHFKDGGIKLDSIDFVVNTTLKQPNYGFFVIAESKSSDETTAKIVGAAMISLEFTDWRNGFFYWIQFVHGTTTEVFDELINKIKALTQEDESCKGMRAVFDGKYSEHWGKINTGLGLEKSHYYIYHIDA